ncbi:bifunctional diguanylate cyclase/phosphodiesterase [Reinekea sp. G2M2-21]|uniref:putative bifunctional diguanylate cyclase/phosphodiesterase n=1 Tax=Reinekea sp. G2M2-21 TaxID=2788942 RepID=UPI0018AB2B96|nr:bifunctional diguanylate cyclase/phosphodiesterase [Reinekea sp. G2M2-21]
MIDKVIDFPALIADELDTQLGVSIMVMDTQGLLQYANHSFQKLCLRKPFELLKSHIRNLPLLYLNEQAQPVPMTDHSHFSLDKLDNSSQPIKMLLKNTNDEIFPVNIKRVLFHHQKATYILLAFLDCESHEQDIPTELMLNSLFNESNEAIVVTDVEPRILDVNPAFERITGYTKDEALGKNPSFLASGYHPKAFYEKFWRSLQTEGRWLGKMVNRRKTGEIYSEQLTVRAIKDTLGQTTHYVSIFSELQKQSETLKSKTDIDPLNIDKLTGLPKYAIFKDRLEQAIGYARRHQLGVAVFSIDIDHFEQFNRQWGVQSGDKIMRSLAQSIQKHIRDGDTLSRASGDEFCLLIRDITNDYNLKDFSDRLLSLISNTISVESTQENSADYQITASIGISQYPDDQATAEQLIRHASHAMSLAKVNGRNQYVFYSSEYERIISEENVAKRTLLNAIENEEMRLHVQPQYNAFTKTIHGVEFLIRWQQEDNDLVYPDQFLNSQKDPEILTAVDQWVIKTVLKLLASELICIVDLSLKVGINLTTSSLLDNTFHDWLIKQLKEAGTSISRLIEIEILEHDALNNLEALKKLISDLKPLGVTFSLDDFGTGYSSLSIFNQLNVDTVKIDKKFVREMIIDSKNLSLVKAICELSKIFDRKTIAEGVEFKEQTDLLLSSGCHIIQGYSIAKPMRSEDFTNWLEMNDFFVPS